MRSFFIVTLLTILSLTTSSQNSNNFNFYNYTFSADSLSGFDEPAVSTKALAESNFGKEYKIYMYNAKRDFIIQKYNLVRVARKETINFAPPVYAASVLPSSGACNNDDFEDAQSNPGMQVGGVVNGWSIFQDFGANYCSPLASGPATNYTVYNSVIIDPFMIAPTNTIGSYFDATSLTQPSGSCFIRLNDATAGAKVVRASKTYTIAPSNALFR
ncbi:MAG: hypothetical protein K0S12_2011, partial [Bacteroidetes bacterium]|nr:hypothetical protein [Bacteroidota bacterium]